MPSSLRRRWFQLGPWQGMQNTTHWNTTSGPDWNRAIAPGGKARQSLHVGAERQADLPQIVSALDPPPGFPARPGPPAEQRHQNTNDRNDDKNLYDSEPARSTTSRWQPTRKK